MKTENQTEDPPEHVATFAELAGRFDYDAATGRTAREEEIASCLAAMDAAAKA